MIHAFCDMSQRETKAMTRWRAATNLFNPHNLQPYDSFVSLTQIFDKLYHLSKATTGAINYCRPTASCASVYGPKHACRLRPIPLKANPEWHKRPMFNPVEFIARQRRRKEGDEYSDEELQQWIELYVQNKIPDYQMAAWLMSVCFAPLGKRETATLTRCYAQSGTQLTWPPRSKRLPLVDKHSSGGVGDKVSLILAPLVASCEIPHKVQVPMMAGRGLGHTGGTIDKLESLKGYNPSQSIQDFQRIVQEVGCAIVCANKEICPADQRLYALRDVTATVESLPLQTASIMSKKIAERPDSIVLDVKYGHGAFQSTVEEAQALAETMVAVGEANGLRPTTAFLTDMNHPLGKAVGNWVEVKECIDIMRGNLESPNHRLSRDLIVLVVVQAGQMLYQSQTADDDEAKKHSLDECIQHAYQVLDSGKTLDKFSQMMLAQGADAQYLTTALKTPQDIPLAKYVATWTWNDQCCYIHDIPAKTMGNICVMLGAGRTVAGQQVDAQAGVIFSKQVGDSIRAGDIVVKVYTNISQDSADQALEAIQSSIIIMPGTSGVPKRRIVTHIVDQTNGTQPFVVPSFLEGDILGLRGCNSKNLMYLGEYRSLTIVLQGFCMLNAVYKAYEMDRRVELDGLNSFSDLTLTLRFFFSMANEIGSKARRDAVITIQTCINPKTHNTTQNMPPMWHERIICQSSITIGINFDLSHEVEVSEEA